MKIRKITATVEFDEGCEDIEEAIQSLVESAADDCASFELEYEDGTVVRR